MEPRGTAVVTGASRGIGRAVAIELANRGFDVVATMRDPSPHASLPSETTGRLRVERLDVTQPDSISLPSGLTVLVNNAATEGPHNPVELSTDAIWREVFETNVFGTASVTRRAIPLMREAGGGVICNITSSALLAPAPLYSAYRASKAAISALGESMRVELEPFGIRVVEIFPGPIDTEMFRTSAPGAEAFASDTYRVLAEFASGLKQGVVALAQTPQTAATAIVDAIMDDGGPLRYGCDPVSVGMLDAWRASTDNERNAGMSGAYAEYLASLG
jgi:NAD(P)-dependent dehydrogenase (short-subunit alcohol dehydrogenase family)